MPSLTLPSLDSEQSPYSYYLDLLGSWPTGIGLASQWLVYFDFSSVNSLTNNFQSVLQNREAGTEWEYTPSTTKYLLDGRLQLAVQNWVGCCFARQVTLPGETITAGNEGLSYGGFMAPATAGTRDKYPNLTVTFLETNASFLDFIIRPWIVSVGYNGLIVRPKGSEKYVRSNFADVVMLAKTGSDIKMGIRKVYRFYNLAPVSIQGETYSYTEDGLRYSDVNFVYDRYAVLDADSSNYMGLA